MKIICSWCKKFMGEKEPFDDSSETHAKCPTCVERQKYQEELKKKQESLVVDVDGIPGYLTVAGKESPSLAFMEIDFSGKSFVCREEQRKVFEKYINGLPSDQIAVTWLHSTRGGSSGEIPKRRKRKGEEPPPAPESPKESVSYNCTIQVSKPQALSIFDSASEKTRNFVQFLADSTYEIVKRETILIDENIRLLFPGEIDIPNLVELLKDREIYENTASIPHPYTEEDAKKFLELATKKRLEFNRTMEWAIRKEKAELIGMIGFHGRSRKGATEEVGFWLGKQYWNQGIMTKVLKKITELGLNEYKFKRIEMKIFSSNNASCRVAEKCGYRFEKIIPAAYQKDGCVIDAKLYAIGGPEEELSARTKRRQK